MIDKDEAIRLLRKEVANKGENFIYETPFIEGLGPQCAYFDNQREPSCIVGHAIADMPEAEEIAVTGHNTCGVNTLRFTYPGLLDAEATEVFLMAQNMQDMKETWGASLAAAERKYRELGGTE